MNHPSAIPWGNTNFFMVLQQWWIPVTEYNSDGWKAWAAGEWRDIPIETIE
jgi:hypothetical protein